MSQAVKVGGAYLLVCEWFLRCTNTTLTAMPHPIYGHVPCCTRCAQRSTLGVEGLVDIEIKVES